MKRWGVLVAALLVLAGLGFYFTSTQDEGPDRITLNRGLSSDPESLDPQKARSVQAASVVRDIGEGLTSYSPSGELVPGAAASWTVSDDGLEYTFALREGLLWSDGEPLTAAHFVHGFRRLVDPAVGAFYSQTATDIVNASAIIAGDAEPESLGVEALDDRTLRIQLEQRVPYLLALVSHPSMFPARPDQDASGSRPGVFNGAYTVAEWQPGSLVRLERNENYWDAANTAIEVVNFYIITEEAAELNRYRAGELDVTNNVPPSLFIDPEPALMPDLHVASYLGVYYYGFNMTKPPFKDNPELRQALSMAIDRERLVEQVTRRGEQPAYSFVPPGVYNYESVQLPYASLSRDQRNAAARRMLAAAGYGPDNPLTIEVRYNTSDTNRRIAVAIQAMWNEVVGVEAVLINEEFQVMLSNINAREITQVFRSSWIGDYNDAQTFLGTMESKSSSNLPGYSNPDYDDLMERAAGQTDLDARRLYLEEAERVLLNDHAIIPLYFYVSKHLVSPKVSGWQDNVLDYHYSRHLKLDAAN
ncbi:MAG: peptide ABC transporter substrate-binding protein [Pseudomonadota bacterium]